MTIHFKTLSEVSGLIQSRQISCVELTTLMLDRIGSLDSTLKSYATVLPEAALASAKQADKELDNGQYHGPLHGIPMAVKDLCFTQGIRTMAGTKVYEDFIPDHDATVITRLKQAGVILLGKLNLSEAGMPGYHPDFEIPVNPWDQNVWTGTSSSGSGVATAAGLAFATLGTDTAGSIRFPAACCGVVGLKPTFGRVSRYGVFGMTQWMDHVGPLTRCVDDAALVLQVIAGHDPQDVSTLLDPVEVILPKPHHDLIGVRIGVDENFISQDTDSEITGSVMTALAVLEKCGADLVRVKMPDVKDYLSAWAKLCGAETILAHEKTYPSRRDDYGPCFRDWLDYGATVTCLDYLKADKYRAECIGKLREVFADIDVLATPTMVQPPHPVTQTMLYGPITETLDKSAIKFTAIFNFNGFPALSIPCGFNRAGLPLSLQLVGHALSESLLLQVGRVYEEQTQWHVQHPAI
ncbi:MAG: amidase [Gammaproteobacteria bacterium]